ncbi:GIY-YIG nuclease family protein, partial [Spongiimicrobium sp. 2-473A-2-J]|uniref:GIY-YIG nuclease family protein n=1 Tax=Eudoraea algarum TaxID=3417568 RepID=UPI003D35FB2A
LYSAKNSRYYIGQTANLDDRIRRHNAGTERATAPYRPWSLVWSTRKGTRGEAIVLERKLKNLSGPRIKDFIHRHS